MLWAQAKGFYAHILNIKLLHHHHQVQSACWNALPDYLKSSDLSFTCFRQQLKHFYFVNIDTSPSTTVAH